MSKLKEIDQQLAQLNKSIERLKKQKNLLEERAKLDQIKKSGVKVGWYYKAVPFTKAGDVLEGKVLKIAPNRWRGGVQITMLVPAKGRFMERTVYVDLDHYILEEMATPSKATKHLRSTREAGGPKPTTTNRRR